MSNWHAETGIWCQSSLIWDVDQSIPDDAPDVWFSKPNGDYYIGMFFHFSSFTFVKGNGLTDSNFSFKKSDFYLSRNQDPYNSWGVNAIKEHFLQHDCMTFWNWLPGITVVDENKKYTLPSEKLSSFAGTEWADNDARIHHGIFSDDIRDNLIEKSLECINKITGPRFSGWPFGYRQLSTAVLLWIHAESKEIHAMLLASNVQSGDKHSYLNRNLYDPGDILGSWNNKPSSWDCRQVLKFIYKSHLLLEDGFHEIALVSASSAVERAFFEIVLYLENNNIQKAQREIKSHTFKQRASQLIKNYGYPLPSELLSGLIDAYAARNDIAHQLSSYSPEKVAIHIAQLENVIEWYYKNIQ